MASNSWLRYGVLALCIAGTTLGLMNTYGDDGDVLAQARVAACGSDDCSYSLLRQQRSAISHQYTFQVALVQKGRNGAGATADVECRRELWLVGEWQCRKQTGSSTPPR